MPARPTESGERVTTGSEAPRRPQKQSSELARDRGAKTLSTATLLAGALTLIGVGLATVTLVVFSFDAGRMVDLTDEGISLLQARPHDANEILPSPFGRVTAPIFWLVRHDLGAFRIAGFLILAVITATLILLTIKSRTRGRVAIAITGGIAAATMHNAEYFRTPNYNWVVGAALGLVAIGLIIVVAPRNRVAEWQEWHRELLGGSILGFGIALTLTARIHSAVAAVIVVAFVWLVSSFSRRSRPGPIRPVLVQAFRAGTAAAITCGLWVLFALVLPAGGVGPLRRDVRNGVDWLNAVGSSSTGGLGRYPGDIREVGGAVAGKLAEQAPGALLGLLVALLTFALVARRGKWSRSGDPMASSGVVVPAMTGTALVGALISGFARGELHAGYSYTQDLGPALAGLVVWSVFGRFVGTAAVASLAGRMRAGTSHAIASAAPAAAEAHIPSRLNESRWLLLTATLVGLAVAVSVGSGNPMAYQSHYGSVLLVPALACVVCLWKEGGGVARLSRRELPAKLLAALLCLTFGVFGLRWVLNARAEPYRQSPLSTATGSFRSEATGITVALPATQGRGLERLERRARAAGWHPGTSLLDITPFHPFVTFWLGGDPPFSVYPAVISPHATKSLLLTISREKNDDLHHAWLLVSSPLLGDIDYSAIARALGRPWPCGYAVVADANLDPTIPPSQIALLRPVEPIPRTCASSG